MPIGHVPRSINIRTSGVMTRKCAPGDGVIVTGVYLPAALYGQRGATLTQDTYIHAFDIEKEKTSNSDHSLAEETLDQINTIKSTSSNDSHLLTRLANSICPEIFGMTEVKQALLL